MSSFMVAVLRNKMVSLLAEPALAKTLFPESDCRKLCFSLIRLKAIMAFLMAISPSLTYAISELHPGQGCPWQRTRGWRWQGCQTEAAHMPSVPFQSSTCLLWALQRHSPGPMIQAMLENETWQRSQVRFQQASKENPGQEYPPQARGRQRTEHEAPAEPQSHQLDHQSL